MMKYIAFLLIFIVILGVLWPLSSQTDYGIGVDSVEWLPPQARNITYWRTSLNRTAEFEIEQGLFEKWCADRDMPLRILPAKEERRASAKWYNIDRCWRKLEYKKLVQTPSEPQKERYGKQFETDDLYYEDLWANGGGYQIGYDVEEAIGYYWYAHH